MDYSNYFFSLLLAVCLTAIPVLSILSGVLAWLLWQSILQCGQVTSDLKQANDNSEDLLTKLEQSLENNQILIDSLGQSFKIDEFREPEEVLLKLGRINPQVAHNFGSGIVNIGIDGNAREWMREINDRYPFIVAEVMTEAQSQNTGVK